jgi:hypothetical protein
MVQGDDIASVITSKAANGMCPKVYMFYPVNPCSRKSNL